MPRKRCSRFALIAGGTLAVPIISLKGSLRGPATALTGLIEVEL